jgi:glycosyltransferase involved in cell wall biosynthesis
VHRAEQHVCTVIDTERCVRCFRQSPYFTQIGFAAMASAASRQDIVFRFAQTVARRVPGLTARLVRGAQRAMPFPVTRRDVDERLDYARSLFARVDRWIAPSPAIGDEYRRLGIDGSKIHVSDYGFVPLLRSTRTRPRLPLRIGYVGTVVWHKGLHVLLDAIRLLPSESYQLTIHGDASVFPDYTAELKTKAVGLPVRFAGGFERGDATAVYAGMDVLVVPSIWMENSPLVIHEAFMAGVPVVAARIGGIPDLVHDGETGFLYEAPSAEALGTILAQLLKHPDALEAMSTRLSASPGVKSIEDDARELEAMYDRLRAVKAGNQGRPHVGEGRAS